MKISLTDAGKRFNREWIFRHLNYQFESGQSYAIIGPNGSGKSTLLQVIGASMLLSQGRIDYEKNSQLISTDTIYREVSICAPYLELIEEMSLLEFLEFHQIFKPLLPQVTIQQIVELTGLQDAANKQMRYYSSGMKQRVKLAQCLLSDTAIVLLDEPCTNFDAAGIALYQQLINDYCRERLVIVSSNDEVEYRYCRHQINISEFKTAGQGV